MAFSLFSSKARNPIAARCRDDSATKLRLRYAPYYHAMEAQQGTTVRLHGKDMIMLASNDYLGLSFHPKVVEAARAAVAKWGTSPTGARVSNGSRAYHVELEEKLAAFLGKEACHIHAAGYLSCLSGIAAFAQKGDVILADKNIHSCLWDGIRLSTAAVERFSHNNADDLRAVVSSLPADVTKMMVIEGVYSMEGHIAHLPALLSIANEYDCFNVLDDAHGFGVLGRQGRGTCDHFGLTDQVDIICGSMSKALARTGVWLVPSLEPPHQVSRKITITQNRRTEHATDMPALSVKLLHRNTPYSFTRSPRGLDRARAAARQVRKAVFHAHRIIRCDLGDCWPKASAALLGWCMGLMMLETRRPLRRFTHPSYARLLMYPLLSHLPPFVPCRA